MENVLAYIKWGIAGLSALLTYLFGGFDMILSVLLVFVVIDYITGVVGAFCNHNVSSEVGFKGIAKKFLLLCVVAVAHLVGQATGIAEIRSFVIGFYIANEGISILENAGKLGVPLPKKLIDVLEQLKSKEEEEDATNSIQQNEADTRN